MAFPGGAGYGSVSDRPVGAVVRDLALGYISVEAARNTYGLSPADIEQAQGHAKRGDTL